MCTGKRQTHIRNAPLSRMAVTGIGPYKLSANSYYFTNFDRKADSPQILKGNCLTNLAVPWQAARTIAPVG